MRDFTDWLLLGGIIAVVFIVVGALLMLRGAREAPSPRVRPAGVPLGPPTAADSEGDAELRAVRDAESGLESRRARVRSGLPAAPHLVDTDYHAALRRAQLELIQQHANRVRQQMH